MFKPVLIASVAFTAIAACQTAPATEQQTVQPDAVEAQAEAPVLHTPPEEIDLFSFAIETGRWNAMIDRAREGVQQAPFPDGDEDLVLRSDRSLKTAVLDLVRLQREACAKELATGEACNQIDVPDWALEPPTADADLADLYRRSAWLGDALQDLFSVGCDAGAKATGDERYCAVE